MEELPPGFRFHPTDEELIVYYLRNQFTSKPCPVSIIPEVNIYKFDPWQLPEKAEFGEKEWYFFTPRDRKYPNGIRPNRATISGYWKATGSDKAIHSGSKYVGIKKSLVFYRGKPPKGIKTDWIMHEYRLSDTKRQEANTQDKKSMRLDDWVLCRIYKKRQTAKAMEDQKVQEETVFQIRKTGDREEEQEMMKFPRTQSHSMEMDYFADPISQHGKFQMGEMPPPPPPPPYQLFNTDYAKFQVNETGIFNHQSLFLNSNPLMYEFSDI